MRKDLSPRPWSFTYDGHGGICIADATGKQVGFVSNKVNPDEQEANAAAITALPDLIDALFDCKRELQACQAVIHLAGGFDSRYVSEAKAALNKAEDALVKAKLIE